MQNPSPRSAAPLWGNWDWPSAGLLIGIAAIAAIRLATTNWTSSLYFGENMAVAGAIMGLWIGHAKLSKLATRLIILNYTLILVPWQVSLLAPNSLPIAERFYSLAPRFSAAWTAFINQQPFSDPIFFITLISLGFWLVGLASGFALTRRRDLLGATLPSGLILLIVQYYDSEVNLRIWLLAVYFFMTLALMGRLYYLDHRETWRTARVFQLPETARDLSNGLLLTSAMVVLVAWTMPVSLSSWQAAEKFWKDLTKPLRPVQERVGDALDPLESKYGTNGAVDFFLESMALGRGLQPSETTIFRVDLPDNLLNAPRLYWRGRTFDTYNGISWSSAPAQRGAYSPATEDLVIPDNAVREVFTFNIHNEIKQSLMYAPSQPVWVSLSGSLLSQPTPDGARDIIAFRANPAMEAGTTYTVHSALANPSIEDLLAAGTNYPAWVSARYLQLPENFSPRIAELALQISADAQTPYQKTAAITAWLRAEIEYQAVIAPIPNGQDPLEWVLFESKRGFCMYYASAEVLMLRSLGIPARMAVGFAQGEVIEDQQDQTSISYLVRRKDYHAWPEVYFPEIGWVEFEPTASQDDLIRPLTNDPLQSAPTTASAPTPLATPEGGLSEFDRAKDELDLANLSGAPWYVTYRAALNWTLAALIIFVLWLYNLHANWVAKIPRYFETRAAQAGTKPPRWIRTWAAWTRLTPMERAFETVNFSLRSFGERIPVHVSAGERAKALTRLLPTARSPVQILTAHHEAALFGRGGESNLPQRGASLHEARRAATSIRLHTILARLIKWWQSILHFIGV